MADSKNIALREAQRFLDALGSGTGALHCFQTFDDDEERKCQGKQRRELVSQFSGTSTGSHMARLSRLNCNGAGVFDVINQTDGRGAKKENITSLRAYWTDLDRDKLAKEPYTLGDVRAALSDCPPSVIIETPGGWHLYWLLVKFLPCGDEHERDEAEALLRRIQARLARFGADPAVCTVNRVLRLPGFYHCKAEPTLVMLLELNNYRYTSAAMAAAFPDIEDATEKPKRQPEPPRPHPAYPSDHEMIEGACRYAAKLPPSIMGQNGSRALFVAALKLLDRFALTELETYDVLQSAFNPRCEPPWSDRELKRAINSAAKVVGRLP
ncbi:MAG: hypothetical protein LBC63_09800 [Holophagales bacterium]|jgi:hypothetical protein|nr:hypothetical protein [Holophagales bacterium]